MEEDFPERSIGYYRGPVDAVLEGIECARIEGALLELDAAGFDDFEGFVDAATSARPDLRERNKRRREGKLRIGPLVIGGTPAMLVPIEAVAAFRERLARGPYVLVMHLAVIDDEGHLVDAPDVGDNEIWVSERLSDDSVRRLRETLGDRLGPLDDPDLSIGYYRGPPERVLAALDAAGLDGAVLEMDGNPPEELYDFAEARAAAQQGLAEHVRRRRYGGVGLGPFRFGGSSELPIPIEGDMLAQLREMLGRHADPELATGLRVRDDRGYLVDAPGVGNYEIWVARRVPSEAIEAMRAALGDGLREDGP
jgi:hypothetical protein